MRREHWTHTWRDYDMVNRYVPPSFLWAMIEAQAWSLVGLTRPGAATMGEGSPEVVEIHRDIENMATIFECYGPEKL